MKSTTKDLLHQLNGPNLSSDERARLRCRIAKQFEEVGNYDAAREVLAELWSAVGADPKVAGLDQETTAEVFLRVGALTGWIGSTKQLEGAQESAKDLISKSIAIFESINDLKKVAEAQTDLAYCYCREGALDDARIVLADALRKLDDQDGDLKAVAVLRSALVDALANRLNAALILLEHSSHLFQASTNHTLLGRFHNELATVLKNLGAAESRADYMDRALIDYAAASFHFEQSGHTRYQACVENNLAMLLFRANRLAEAHEHLDRAQALFTTLRDVVHLAQVGETRARVMLAQGEIVPAERFARTAVQLLENGDERSLQAEALTTHGIALSRLNHKEQARTTFERAIEVAEQGHDLESAGLAALTLVEQLSEHLSDDELFTILKCADQRLENTQNADSLRRLKNGFRHFVPRVLWPDWPTALRKSVRRHEERQILRALVDSGGVISQAARLLQLSHEGLRKILNTRHKKLRKMLVEIKAGKSVDFSDENVLQGLSRAEVDAEATAENSGSRR